MRTNLKNTRAGFTLIELLIVIALIGMLAAIVTFAVYPNYQKARDARRKIEVGETGKLLAYSCYTPDAGPGDYDLKAVADELTSKYPQYASMFSQIPRDPAKGTANETFYRYAIDASHRCALYANLENESEAITLPGITSPTPGGGTGIFKAASAGWNGSTKYYQFSN